MPIYEFFCARCNTVFNFFSKTVNTTKIPLCPSCQDRPLERKMSLFARVRGGKDQEGEGGEDMPPLDEGKMERAMAMLASEAERLDEDDPRQAAHLMRKLTDATGLHLGSGMEEALRRLERGEDPEQIEEEMGDLLESEEPFLLEGKAQKGGRKTKPRVDDALYEL